MTKIRLGVSSCLLGAAVRYDGGHKLDSFLAYTLGRYVEFVPVCPELECGFGVPRDPMRLEGNPGSPRLVSVITGRDLTDRLVRWSRRRLEELAGERLDGFVFKGGSPSCGVTRLSVYDDAGVPRRKGTGIFTRLFAERFPRVPVEEEGRLRDPEFRENFVERIFLLRSWRDHRESGMSRGGLADFHARHEMLLLAHSGKHCRVMGRLAARDPESGLDAVYAEYEKNLAQAISVKATARKNVHVLIRATRYLKRELSPAEKEELLGILNDYREGRLPLIVPLILLNHYIRKHGPEYLGRQRYFHPDPLELLLRFHA
jgi:uncharacterized protein YbgA (DUF1722 family)/uncharacterized protein YbbK (DUF523 family)